MIKTDKWIGPIKECLNQIADLNFQKKACSSFDELICKLYDDYDFYGFLNHVKNENVFSVESLNKLELFSEKLENFLKTINEKNLNKIIVNPQWQEISNFAKEILKSGLDSNE